MSDAAPQVPAVSSTTSTASVEAPSDPGADPATKTKKTKVVKKKKKNVNKGPTDEQLFGNTDDIFGDIPEAKPKSPKTKKKKKATGETATESETTGEYSIALSQLHIPTHQMWVLWWK